MIRWGTQPNHEFGNRRSKLLHSSWHASQRYNNFTVINICYLSITINTLRVLSKDFSIFAMIRWGTQPNHEFGNRRSKLQHNSWYGTHAHAIIITLILISAICQLKINTSRNHNKSMYSPCSIRVKWRSRFTARSMKETPILVQPGEQSTLTWPTT